MWVDPSVTRGFSAAPRGHQLEFPWPTPVPLSSTLEQRALWGGLPSSPTSPCPVPVPKRRFLPGESLRTQNITGAGERKGHRPHSSFLPPTAICSPNVDSGKRVLEATPSPTPHTGPGVTPGAQYTGWPQQDLVYGPWKVLQPPVRTMTWPHSGQENAERVSPFKIHCIMCGSTALTQASRAGLDLNRTSGLHTWSHRSYETWEWANEDDRQLLIPQVRHNSGAALGRREMKAKPLKRGEKPKIQKKRLTKISQNHCNT